jgi:hypothetical protein
MVANALSADVLRPEMIATSSRSQQWLGACGVLSCLLSSHCRIVVCAHTYRPVVVSQLSCPFPPPLSLTLAAPVSAPRAVARSGSGGCCCLFRGSSNVAGIQGLAGAYGSRSSVLPAPAYGRARPKQTLTSHLNGEEGLYSLRVLLYIENET